MPYGLILNVAVVVVFIIAFIKAEDMKPRIILAAVMALIILLPRIVHMAPTSWMWWVHYIGKVVFGLCCIVYIKWSGMAY